MKKVILTESQLVKLIKEAYKYNEPQYEGVQEITYAVIDTYDEDDSLWDTEYLIMKLECRDGFYDKLNERSSEDDLTYYVDEDCAQSMINRKGQNISEKKYKNEDGETIVETEYYLDCNQRDNFDFSNTSDIDEFLTKKFGITNNPYTCGYILTNGKMLNLGNNYGDRTIDHISPSSSINMSVNEMVKMGYIRISPESPGFQCFKMPTNEQYYTLKDIIRNFINNSNLYVDLSENDGFVYNKGTNPNKIAMDVIRFFEQGIKPIL